MTYTVYSDGSPKHFDSLRHAILFTGRYDPEGTTPLLIKDSDGLPLRYRGELMLTYSVDIQEEDGWRSYIFTDDLEDALETMEAAVNTFRCPARIVENDSGNVVYEFYPYFNDPEFLEPVEFDWKEHGF